MDGKQPVPDVKIDKVELHKLYKKLIKKYERIKHNNAGKG